MGVVNMFSPEDVIFGVIISVTIVFVFWMIRFFRMSVILATVISVLVVVLTEIILVYRRGGDFLEIICVGPLLAIAFGLPVNIFGRWLEKKVKP